MVDLIDNVNRTQTNPTVDRRTDYAGAQSLERKIITDRDYNDRLQQLTLRQRQNFTDRNREIGQSIIREATLAKAEQFAQEFDQANGIRRIIQNNEEDTDINDNGIVNNVIVSNERNISQIAQQLRLRQLADDSSEARNDFIAERLREESQNNQKQQFAFNNEGRFTAPNTRLGQLFDRFA